MLLAVPFLVIWHEQVWWWAEVHTGTVNESGPWYGFFSGFGSDLSEVAILGAVLGAYRKHNCHEKGCPRIGRHVVDGTPWCNRHHEQAREKGAK